MLNRLLVAPAPGPGPSDLLGCRSTYGAGSAWFWLCKSCFQLPACRSARGASWSALPFFVIQARKWTARTYGLRGCRTTTLAVVAGQRCQGLVEQGGGHGRLSSVSLSRAACCPLAPKREKKKKSSVRLCEVSENAGPRSCRQAEWQGRAGPTT